ncbi:MAG: hypothetical protein NTU41_05585, partial [Chloroflexi bacterium]|nr:hypothetical protein [Chloroflexota bacterium]
WIQPSGSSFGGHIIDNIAGGGGDGGWFLRMNCGTPHSLTLEYWQSGAGSATGAVTAGSLSNGTWYHVVGVIDTNNNCIKLYVNGQQVGSSSAPGQIGPHNDPFQLSACDWASPTRQYNGKIDDVAIYDTALTADQITALYSMGARIASPPATTFIYDGDGNRVLKTESGQTTLYVNPYYEKNLTTGEVTTHYYLGDREIAYKNNSGLRYVSQDQLGSTVTTTNSSGSVVSTVKYYPYGECRISTGNLDTDELFTGQRLDDTGLYYYNARYYDAAIGRFISADTIVPDPSDPQNLNRYSYCLNNPLAYVDPSGHNAVWDAIVQVVVGPVRDKAEDLTNTLYCLNTWVTQPSQSSLSQFGISLGTLLSSQQMVGKIQSGWRTGDEELFREGVIDACIYGAFTAALLACGVGESGTPAAEVGEAELGLGEGALEAMPRGADEVVGVEPGGIDFHGNDLRTLRPARGYALVSRETGEVLKYGDTIHGTQRYSQTWLDSIGAEMKWMASGTKREMHYWQHDMILQYGKEHGVRPPLNLTDW